MNFVLKGKGETKGFLRTFARYSYFLVYVELSFTYSPWWLAVGFVIAAIITLLVYRRNARMAVLPREARLVAAGMRFMALLLVVFLLTGPTLRQNTTRQDKPLILFLTDNSASMLMHADSQWVRKRLPALLDSLREVLAEDFDVVHYAFGSGLQNADSLSFRAPSSAYDRAFREALESLEGRRLRGIVLTGDGRYNEGLSPLYAARQLGVPIFCLMTGDTLSQANAAIADLAYNQVTLTGNRFPVEVTLAFQKMQGRRAVVALKDETGATVDRKEIVVPSGRFTEKVTLFHTAEKNGILAYSVVVSAGEESHKGDNTRRFFIEAVGNRLRVLFAADAPHPDIGALRQALANNRNVEVVVATGDAIPDKSKDFNLVVLHQVPGLSNNGHKLLQNLKEEKTPYWLITGPNTRSQLLQQYGTGIVLTGTLPGRMDEFYLSVNPSFSAFDLSGGLQEFLKQLPPLETPFGNYQMPAGGDILIYRRIGQTVSTLPTAVLVNESGSRRLLWLGSGLWRWRMINYEKHQNFQYFEELVGKIVQYLSLSDDKSRFRLQAPTLLEEGQNVVFRAEVYNPSYERVNTAAVTLNLTDSAGRSFEYVFKPGDSFYELDLGHLPPGRYRYTSKAQLAQESFSKPGMLVIEAADKERRVAGSDFGTLMAMSQETGGVALLLNQAHALPELIKEKTDRRLITWTETTVRPLIHQKFWFFLLLALLTAEWVIRKYFGSY